MARSRAAGPSGGSGAPLFQVLASILCLVFVTLAVLHLYWAVGGPLGLEGAIPAAGDRPPFEPGPGFAVAVAVALIAAAMVCAQRGGLLSVGLPEWAARLGNWMLVLVFAARAVGEFHYVGFFKRVRDSLFARRDSLLYTPLCVVISALAAALALLAP